MSRLTSITLENFKAYGKSQKIPIKPLTLIFGPNSAGKSSIFHALAFLKECHATGGHCSPDEVELGWESVSLGGWQNLIHDHDSTKAIKLGLGFDNVEIAWTFEYKNSDFSATVCEISKDINLSAVFSNVGGEEATWRGALSVNDPVYERLLRCAWEFLNTGGLHGSPVHNPNDIKVVGNPDERLVDFDVENFENQFFQFFVTKFGFQLDGFFPGMVDYQAQYIGDYPGEQPRPRYAQMNIREKLIQEFEAGDISTETFEDYFSMINWLAFQECVFRGDVTGGIYRDSHWALASFEYIERYVHLGPLRQPPQRDLDMRTLRGDKKLAAWTNLLADENLREKVNKSLVALDVKYEVVTRRRELRYYAPDSDLNSVPESCDSITCLAFRNLMEGGKSTTSSHLDLGFGVSAILPILVALESNSRLISMEQPEMHIHPRLQNKLGDLLIRKAFGQIKNGLGRYDRNENTVLVETHSELLILRILRRIRETTAGEMEDWPEALREACPQGIQLEDIAVIYVQPGENGSEVIHLPITPDGGFSCPWPEGFFEEQLNELS